MIVVVLFVLLVGAMAAWGLVSPQSQWRTLQSWRFKHPDANEPSGAGYAVQRVGCGVVLVVVLVALFQM